MRLLIKRHDVRYIIDRARDGYPYEVCGLVGGRISGDTLSAETITAVPNVSAQPQTGYEMDRRAMVEAILTIQRAGREVVAIYHSHPDVEPIPSPADVSLATWPDVVWLIIGISADAAPDIRAWTIRYGKATAAEMQILEL